jgi:dTMP kinase
MSGPLRFYGEGLPYLDYREVKGCLIAVEGTDGVGRSTQVDLLKRWLQVNGYGVVETGWTRSKLVQRALDMAKAGNLLNRMTFSLLYAADFADRLENVVLPALRSGFVVLSDRYVHTAFARDHVRGADRRWIRDLFGFAPVPDLVCYLRIDLDRLIPRVLESGGMSYWESGMDLRMGEDIFDSFKNYQAALLAEYDRMAQECGFEVVDAGRSIEAIQADLQDRIAKVLPIRPPAAASHATAPTTG